MPRRATLRSVAAIDESAAGSALPLPRHLYGRIKVKQQSRIMGDAAGHAEQQNTYNKREDEIACEDMTMHPRQETLLEIRHMLHPSARYAVAPSCAGMKWR